MRVVDSELVLTRLGYTFVKHVTSPRQPEKASMRFADLVPELLSFLETKWLAEQYLYKHQLEALKALEDGHSVVLRSGTGSGKTEAWVFYALRRAQHEEFRTIALYPTLALANDQVQRISKYAKALGIPILQLDAVRRDELVKQHGVRGLRALITNSKLLITNPAFLLHEIKKMLLTPTKSLLFDYLSRLSMLVIDELDFYSPRSIALLLAMIEFIAKISDRKPQIAILTATLANPEDVCRFLEEVAGRSCIIVDGKPFSVENRLYIVLGKNLEQVWKQLHKYLSELQKRTDVDKDILQALEDFNKFKHNAYRVVLYLRAMGFDVPSIGLDIDEILASYAEDEGVTLVFTKSIARADEIAKRLRNIVGDRVASHHHLIPKKRREEIEERARRGEVKIVVSPRTLTQGIDIGTIVRVVHIGLPETVREYLQREGRKGRRTEIPHTETIIIPSSRWDWELLSKGLDALMKWLSLPLERVSVNPRNKYITLFRALAKILSPWYRSELSEDERRALQDAGIIKRNEINIHRARWIWDRINFYEFGPPYGIKRYLHVDDELQPLEPIGHCDLVERFQVGCFDVSNDAIVVKLNYGKSSRIVTSVTEKSLNAFSFYEHDAIAEAFEEYRFIKSRWGEEPSILRDIARGKLHSYVLAVVYPPRHGFGELKKVPNRVIWYLISEKPRISTIGGRHVVTYDRKHIYVPVNTGGEYRDFTYGMVFETNESENSTLLRLGLALLMIVLRRIYGIAFETIMYGVERIGEKKFFELHEPEAAGLLESIDWLDVRRAVEMYQPDDLDLVLLSQIDDIAYSDMISLNLDWDNVKKYTLRVIDYILLRDRITACMGGRRIAIPRPSKALRILALDMIAHDMGVESTVPRCLIAIAAFDGEDTRALADLYVKMPFAPPPRELRDFETQIEDLVYYEGFSLIISNREAVKRELERARLKRLLGLLDSAIDLSRLLEKLGVNPPSYTSFLENIELEGIEKPDPNSLLTLHNEIRNFIEVRGEEVTKLPDYIARKLVQFLANRVYALYIAYLVARQLLEAQ